MSERLRVGVVGCGLVAQAVHLPYLAHLGARFELAGIAEPSETVRDALARRYGVPVACSDYRELLDTAALDALVVCSPNATHAEIVLAALDAGLHVLVEKPLCITVDDADAIVAAAEASGKVVQVGYMKRFDPAYERLVDELPPTTAALRYVSVVVHDPEFVPYFGPEDLVRGGDVDGDVSAALRRSEREQVERAIGESSDDAVFALSDGYLGSLVHDVNLVHGLLAAMGEPLPARVVGAAAWADGRALTGAVELASGARWDSAWIQLLDLREYRESVTLYFESARRTLTFPSPWLRQSPTRYEHSGADGSARAATVFESYEESYQRQLVHFHEAVVNGAPRINPPEEARLDIAVLTEMCRVARGAGSVEANRDALAR